MVVDDETADTSRGPVKRWSIETRPGLLCLGLTRWGRVRAGASTFVLALLVALAALAVFFVPDFLREVGRQGEGFTGFFGVFLGGAALLVASIAGIMKALSTWRWEFDWSRGLVRLSTRTTMGQHFDDELDLERVRSIGLERADSMLGAHALTLRLADSDGDSGVIVLVRTRTSLAELEAIHTRLDRALRAAHP